MSSEFISITELAKLTGVSRPTMLRMLNEDRGPKYYKLPSGVMRVRRDDAELWLSLLKQADTVCRKLLGWR